jgi:small-conductance mechanosensitive channel
LIGSRSTAIWTDMSIADNAGEALANNAGDAIDSGRGTVESLINWFSANSDELPIGLAVAAGIVGFMLVLRWIGSLMIAGDPECTRWRGVLGRVLWKTSVFFMVAASVDILTTYTDVPRSIAHLADIVFTIAFALQGAIWARELILGIVARKAGEDPHETMVGNAMSVIRVLVSVALFGIAVIVILDNLGVNVTALVAGFGIGGIAIGLAAQGIFGDLFAALAILFDKPFRRGDTIRYGTSTGTVERIGLKTTRLRSLTGEMLVMANTQLLEQEIHNFAVGHSKRSTLNFGVIYQTHPDLLEQIPEIARGVVRQRTGLQFGRCAITDMGASAINFELIFDSATVDADVAAADRTVVVANLLRTFSRHGIEFAYPTQTTFTAAPDGTMIMPYAAVQPVKEVPPTGAESRPERKKA